MATAPQAIWNLWYRVRDEYNGPGLQDEELAGIVGDRNHSFGFHLSRNDLAANGVAGSDYSLQTTRDRAGANRYPDDASALDIHFGPQGMIAVTKRLIAAAQARDPRMNCLYEFCGTTNGVHPHPYTVDTHTDDPNNSQGWDDSHVTHVHLSIHRDVCNNFVALQGVADIIAGAGADIVDAATIKAIAAAAASATVTRDIADDPTHPAPGQDPHPVAPLYKVLVNTQSGVDSANAALAALKASIDANTAALKAIEAKLP